MVTQTPAFFPVPTAAIGNNATGGVPIAMGDGSAAQQPVIPFANALTQAQTQTQAGMNPLFLALLNGLAGLPTATGIMPAVPTLSEAAATETPIAAETSLPGQETIPEDANITLLAMAALCLNPLQATAEPIAPQAPFPTGSAEMQAIPSANGMPLPMVPQVSTEKIAAVTTLTTFAAQVQTEQITTANSTIPSGGQKPVEEMTLPMPTGTAAPLPEQQPVGEAANSPQPLSMPTMPAQLLEAQAKLGVNIKAVQGQQTEIIGDISQNPIQHAQIQHTQTEGVTVDPSMAAIVSSEPNTLPIAQGVAKKIAALPIDTERAIALPTLAIPTPAGSLSSEGETSGEKQETPAEQAIPISEVNTQNKPDASPSVSSFSQTLDRMENAGQTASFQTEAVKPQAADRYEVAAQVTKHLETMTAAGGRSELVLQLKPEHLGQVKITLSTSENGLSAKITMDSAQAHQAMTGAKETLRSAFEQRGINLESLDVSLNQQAFGNGQQAFAGMQMGHSHSQTFGTRYSTAAQTAFAGDDEAELPLVVAGQNTASGLNRLDFRA